MASASCRSLSTREFRLREVLSSAPKFDAAFLERRMAEHRAWQEAEQERIAQEITREVLDEFSD